MYRLAISKDTARSKGIFLVYLSGPGQVLLVVSEPDVLGDIDAIVSGMLQEKSAYKSGAVGLIQEVVNTLTLL